MKVNYYSVFDKLAKVYLKPFPATNHSVAIRLFSDIVQDDKAPFFAHPEDYDLYAISYFDNSSGLFENLKNPVPLAKATDFAVKDLLDSIKEVNHGKEKGSSAGKPKNFETTVSKSSKSS